MNPLSLVALKKYLCLIYPAACIGLMSSCTNSSHLLLYQHSSMGMNTGINPANQSVHVRIGARSEFAAVVPKYIKRQHELGNEPEFEAASAYFGSRFRVSSIWKTPEAAEVLVTGQAAVIAASKGRLRLKENHDKPQEVIKTQPVDQPAATTLSN
jgi:hypothetical protein